MKTSFKINKIVVPVDFSKTSLKAIDYAVEMAKLNKATISLLHVVESVPAVIEPGYFQASAFPVDWYDSFSKESDKHLKKICSDIISKGAKVEQPVTATGRIQSEVNNLVDQLKADIIIMGTHGVSGFQEFFAGSNTFRVIRNATVPVLSINEKSTGNSFKNILVPFRDNPHSREKVDYAVECAKMYNATVHVLAMDTQGGDEHFRKMQLEGEQVTGIINGNDIPCVMKVVRGSYIADEILSYAKEENADLILSMSDLEKMNITEYFTGPFAQQIVNHSPIPVLSIRPAFNTNTVDMRFY